MAFQIQVPFSVQLQVPAVPRKTDPIIKCIIDNKLKRLCQLLKGRDINSLYSSEVWKDDVTPLIAAVICKNEEICSHLLKESADPNKHSTNGQTPLHYAALTTGVPLSIVERLIAAKANPDGHGLQKFTPLQCAVYCGHEDIVKALIEAGASAVKHYGLNPELDKKVETMMCQLYSQGEMTEIYIHFSFHCAVRTKKQTEVYRVYKEHFFQEDPFEHLIYFEHYFNVIGPSEELPSERHQVVKRHKECRQVH